MNVKMFRPRGRNLPAIFSTPWSEGLPGAQMRALTATSRGGKCVRSPSFMTGGTPTLDNAAAVDVRWTDTVGRACLAAPAQPYRDAGRCRSVGTITLRHGSGGRSVPGKHSTSPIWARCGPQTWGECPAPTASRSSRWARRAVTGAIERLGGQSNIADLVHLDRRRARNSESPGQSSTPAFIGASLPACCSTRSG
jgi:hypothetical protein